MQHSGPYSDELDGARARLSSDLEKLLQSQSDYGEIDPADSLLAASDVLVAVAIRSIRDALDLLTVRQYVTMAVLEDGPLGLPAIAAHPDAALAEIDGLVQAGWVREVIEVPGSPTYELTAHGAQLIAQSSARRRAALSDIIELIPESHRPALARSLALFTEAAAAQGSGG